MRRILILSLLSCLVLSLAAYILYQRYTREIETSSWSTKGEWIVFGCGPDGLGAQSSLFLVRPDGSEVTRLTTGRKDATSPSWSPDGEEIVFQYHWELYKIRRGSNKPIPLNTLRQHDGFEWFPEWSPDGQWIAFVSKPVQGADTLFRVSTDGRVLQRMFTESMMKQPTWSPAGDHLILASQFGKDSILYKIFEDRTIIQEPLTFPMNSPTYSPDGNWLAYDDFDDIYVIHEASNEKRQLTELPGIAHSPSWSPDGQWLVFSYREQGETQLWKVRIDGSELQPITTMDCNCESSDWIRMP